MSVSEWESVLGIAAKILGIVTGGANPDYLSSQDHDKTAFPTRHR